jgi:hypothetical protein
MARINLPFYRTTPAAVESEDEKSGAGAELDPEQRDGKSPPATQIHHSFV